MPYRKTILLLCLLVLKLTVSAQKYVWAKKYAQPTDATCYDGINAITTDDSGNVYVAGPFNNVITVNDTVFTPPYYSGHFFMAKVGPGGVTAWVKGFYDGYFDHDFTEPINDIKADQNSGKVYYCGSEHVAALLPDGSMALVIWLGDTNLRNYNASVSKIALQGNYLYLAGTYSDTLQMGDSTFIPNHLGYGNTFIAKYNLSTNQYAWVRQISQSPSINSICGLVIDTSGNVFIAGSIGFTYQYGHLAFYPDTSIFGNITVASHNYSNGFVAKLNNMGNYEWVKNYGVPSVYYSGFGLGMDSQQQVYFAMQPAIDTGAAIMVKLNEAGQQIWYKQYAHTYGFANMACANQAIYLSGNNRAVTDQLNLGDTVIQCNYINYILCVDTGGNFNWLSAYPAVAAGSAYITYLAATNNGLIYSAGTFTGGLPIGNSSLQNNGYYLNDYLALLYNHKDPVAGSATVSGRIFYTNDSLCVFDSAAQAAKYFGVIATPGNYIATTDTNGNYDLSLPPGSYTISGILPEVDNGIYTMLCPQNLQYPTGQLNSGTVDTANNFAIQISTCAYAAFYYYGSQLIPCDSFFNFPIRFCNYTNIAVDSVEIQLGVSDSISFVSTNPPYNYRDSVTNKLVLQIPHLAADTCIFITVRGERLCNQLELAGIIDGRYSLVCNSHVANECSGVLNYFSIWLDTNGFAGLTNTSQQPGLKIYPNPTQGMLFIQPGSTIQNSLLTLCDITGKEIMRRQVTGADKNELDLNYLAPGVYILSCQNEQGIVSKLVLKQ